MDDFQRTPTLDDFDRALTAFIGRCDAPEAYGGPAVPEPRPSDLALAHRREMRDTGSIAAPSRSTSRATDRFDR